MNEVYQDLLTPIMYKWVLLKYHGQVHDNSYLISFSHEIYEAIIQFHENHILELSIQDKKTSQIVFYLHFQMYDMKSTVENIQLFFQYLDGSYHENHIHLKQINKKQIKILLSCTSGLTTSYFASLMQDALKHINNHIQIDAVALSELEKVQSQYDYVLLAPQVAYQYQSLKAKYGSKLLKIDAMDFASGNVHHVLQQMMKVS